MHNNRSIVSKLHVQVDGFNLNSALFTSKYLALKKYEIKHTIYTYAEMGT
jgi:hypothetical protein